MALANIALTDTFDTWRIRTNQIIVSLDQANTLAYGVEANSIAGLVKANAANVLAFNTGIGANAWANTIGTSSNTYADMRVGSANGWANFVGTSANARSIVIGSSGNAYAQFIGASANSYTNAAILSATTGTAQLAYANTIGARSNTWANTVGAASNNYTLSSLSIANNYANVIGGRANSWANTVGDSANNYANFTAASSNGRTLVIGAASNTWSNTIGAASNTWANTIGTYSNAISIAAFNKANNALPNTTATLAGTLTTTGSVLDSKGDVRDVPISSKSTNYQLTGTDAGRCVSISSGDITLTNDTLSPDDAVTIFNNSGSSRSIIASGVTLYLAGTALTGTRTIAQRGLATILCVSTNVFVISGSGLS